MTQCIFESLPNWIQALAAIGIVGLTVLTLIVLKGYAEDTKKIAKASVAQIENSRMPFIAVTLVPPPPGHVQEWMFANQGFGPAINVDWSLVQNDTRHPVHPLAVAAVYKVPTALGNAIDRQTGVEVNYESLSGVKYRTVITWVDGVMHTVFHKHAGAAS